jgi:hypothetical protein
MPLPIEVNGPIIEALPNPGWFNNITFSVQLTTGMVVTNPEQFPNGTYGIKQPEGPRTPTPDL